MALRAKRTDPQVVRDLIKLHRTLNNEGQHWVKGTYKTFIEGRGNCFCLVGGVNEIAGIAYLIRATYDGTSDGRSDRRKAMMEHLKRALPDARYNRMRLGTYSLETSLTRYNDARHTSWEHINDLILTAIAIGRGELEPLRT